MHRSIKGRDVLLAAILVLGAGALALSSGKVSLADEDGFTDQFRVGDCSFRTMGVNPYFVLLPGYRLVLEGEDDGETLRVQITVLHETEKIRLEGGVTVRTRVVEEREWVDGEIVEISRNFFAICKETNDVYYFGEDVDIFEDGEVVSHDGAWRAGTDGAKPGIVMPGTFLLGSRYFQEIAPGVAMDRAENVAMGLSLEIDGETLADCVKVVETTPLEPGDESVKLYAAGVGLVVDDQVELVSSGFVGRRSGDHDD